MPSDTIKDLTVEVDIETRDDFGECVHVKLALPKGGSVSFGLSADDASSLALAIDKAADELHARKTKTVAHEPE